MDISQLYELFLKCPTIFTDSRKVVENGMFFALKGDKFDGNDYALGTIEQGAGYAVVDREELANNDGCILVKNVLETLQQLANFHRKKLNIPVIAITGTNGKTTTKELLSAVLRKKYKLYATQGNLNNHIGVPLTLLSLTSEHQVAIIEMGASHPKDIEQLCGIADPDFGLITNVGKAHLEGFGSFEGVINTKGELYHHLMTKNAKIFVNKGNPHLMNLVGQYKNISTYSIYNNGAQLVGDIASNDIHLTAKILFPKGWLYVRTKLTGAYNVENVMAAACIGMNFNVDPLDIQSAIESYTPQNNRSQLLDSGKNKVLLDCYNANPTSMEAAIKNFIQINRSGKVFILGDMLELGFASIEEHQRIVNILVENRAESVILVGTNFAKTNTPNSFKKFDNVRDLNEYFAQEPITDHFFLVKGSRGVSLEKIIDYL